MLRMRVCVFIGLGVLFCLGVVIVARWGHRAVVTAYRPVLVERISSECGASRFNAAETLAIQALRTTPQYADTIRTVTQRHIKSMPRLAAELERALSVPAGQ